MMWARAVLMPLLVALVVTTGSGIAVARGALAADGALCAVTGHADLVMAHDGLPLFDAEGEPVLLDRSGCLNCLWAAFTLQDRLAPPAAPVAATGIHASWNVTEPSLAPDPAPHPPRAPPLI